MKSIKYILFVFLAGYLLFSCSKTVNYTYTHETEKSFPIIEVEGSYYDIGYAVGLMSKNELMSMLEMRKDWFEELKTKAGEGDGSLYQQLYDQAFRHYPQYIEELQGIAKGAGVDFREIFILNIKAELGVENSPEKEEDPGCSTIYFNGVDGKFLLHNEDGHRAFTSAMFIVKATPPSGVSFVALTYAGIMVGNGPGFNDRGIIQTTNYIAGMSWQIGIPRYFVNRAVLEAKTLDEAIGIAGQENRAFAYHHNLGDFHTDMLMSVEVTPKRMSQLVPEDNYYHTNHLIHETFVDFQQDEEYVQSSSMSRFEVLDIKTHSIQDNSATFKDVFQFLASHDNEPFSTCRHPKGDINGVTLGTAVFDLNRDVMIIFKGSPCQSYQEDRITEFKLADMVVAIED
jgi:predicted choloylglycine hydrolase